MSFNCDLCTMRTSGMKFEVSKGPVKCVYYLQQRIQLVKWFRITSLRTFVVVFYNEARYYLVVWNLSLLVLEESLSKMNCYSNLRKTQIRSRK